MNNTTTTATASSSSSSERCESGWTLYLDHSTQFLTTSYNNNDATAAKSHRRSDKIPCAGEEFYDCADYEEDEEDEEEDLSMVSDASSGPPHFEEEEEEAEDLFCCGGGRKRGTSHIHSNVKLGRRRFEFDGEDFALDDTASSHPMMNNMNMIFSSKECVENQASPIKSLIDYSSQGFSATHYQVVVKSRKRR